MASIRKRGENSWQIRVCAGYDSAGKKLEKLKTVQRPAGISDKAWQKELEKLALEFEREVEKGTCLDGSKITLAEFAEKWLKEYAQKELAPKTFTRYKELLYSRIVPALGHIKLDKLQPTHLIQFYNNLAEAGIRLDGRYAAKDELKATMNERGFDAKSLSAASGVSEKTIRESVLTGKPVRHFTAESICKALNIKLATVFSPYGEPGTLSSRTVLHHHRVISTILQDAVEWQVIFSNPADRVKPPKVEKKAVQHYDEEQTKKLLQAIDGEEMKYKVMVILDVFTGLRLGELMGLTWEDVNLETGVISVTKASQHISGIGTFEKAPKNESSVRRISIPAPIVSLLKEYRKHWLSMQLAAGDLWQKSNKLFVTWDGRPMFTYTLTNWFPEFLKRHNLPKITPHGLRHTMASLLDSQGLEVSAISKRLGHARISTTLDIYTHVFKKADTVASSILERTLLDDVKQEESKKA